MSRPVECECASNFTCGYCLRNTKPHFYTLSNGSAIAVDMKFGIMATILNRPPEPKGSNHA